MARVTRRKIDKTLKDVEKQFKAMGVGNYSLAASARELEEDRAFDVLMDIKEKFHKKQGTREMEYDLDPNEL